MGVCVGKVSEDEKNFPKNFDVVVRDIMY